MKALHTFAICAYKESPFLEECIRSLEKQKLKTKIIIITSTPNDFIKKTAEKYKIPLYINEGEKGITQDWNFGYKMADTKYVTIAHQDDVYLPEYTKYLLPALEKQKLPLIGFTDYQELRDGKVVGENSLLKIKRLMLIPLRFQLFYNSKFVRRRILSLGCPICCPAVTLCKASLPGKVFQPGFRSNEDWQAWELISRKKGAFVYCKKPLMYHRIHEDSETSIILGDNARTKEDYMMFQKFWPKSIARCLTKLYANSEKSNKLS